MSRTVKLILTIVLIIAAAMWLLTVYRTCQKNKTDDTEITTNGTGAEGTNTTIIDTTGTSGLEDLYDDETEDTGTTGNASDNSTAYDTGSDEEEDTEADEDETATKVGANDSAFDNKSGNYLVVAGAFVAKSNADKYQKELIKKGYNAEVRIFLGSDYHSVILGDYATEGEALTVAKKLGGEAYVHKRRFPKRGNRIRN